MLQNLAIKPKQLFLIDSLGALLTAFLVGLILPEFESFFGAPRLTCHILALIALGFAAYSMICYFFMHAYWRVFMRVIAFANLTYCLITLLLLIYGYQLLTIWGVLYFGGELCIVVGLAYLELRTVAQK